MNVNAKMSVLVLGAFVLSPIAGSNASIILYNSQTDTDYVASGSASLSRSWSLSGSTGSVSFSDSSALSPTSGYNGPAFFGGASATITGSGTTTSGGNSASVQHQASPNFDRINLTYNIQNTDSSSKTATSANVLYFKSGASFNVTSPTAFTANVSDAFSGAQTVAARWVVRTGTGQLYVSNETVAFGGDTSDGLTTTTWALLNTSGSDLYQTYGAFGALPLTGLTGAGIYYEGQRTGITATGSVGTGSRLNTFEVVPEPTSLSVIALAGAGLLRRRRR